MFLYSLCQLRRSAMLFHQQGHFSSHLLARVFACVHPCPPVRQCTSMLVFEVRRSFFEVRRSFFFELRRAIDASWPNCHSQDDQNEVVSSSVQEPRTHSYSKLKRVQGSLCRQVCYQELEGLQRLSYCSEGFLCEDRGKCSVDVRYSCRGVGAYRCSGVSL